MEAREYLKLATDKTEAGDLIKENNLTEAIIKMLENYALIRVKNCSIPDVVGRSEQLCRTFLSDGTTSSATKCRFCGKEKWQH